jgi:hypothetical protein
MKITIAFITGRPEPHLDWALDTLQPQLAPGDEIDMLVIDARGRSAEQLAGDRQVPGVHVRVESPKPTPWQGTHRVTSCDWWAKSSAMNTAFVLCATDYIAFLDDSCRLGPKWLETVRQGCAKRSSVLAGTYVKIEHGREVRDHRFEREPEGKKDCGGGWLFGCTFALPLAWALEVNGAEEGCDGMGSEDYIFGLMLENNKRRIDFVPSLAVVQERPEQSGVAAERVGPLRRTDKGVSPKDKSHAALARFGKRQRTEFSPDLRTLRARRASGDLTWPLPDPNMRDWYDGQLVREMK